VELPISIGETNRERLVSLDPSVTGALLQLQRGHAMLLDECLLAVLASAVRQWTRQPVTAIRLLYHGRTDSFAGIDVSRTVGWFATEIPVVLEIPSLADFEQTLQLVKNHMRMLPRNGIGYGVLRYLTGNETLASLRAPEIRLNHLGRLGQSGGNSLLQSRSVGFGRGNSLDCLIELRTYIYENRLYEQWLYDERIYREDTMDVLVESFNNSLSQAIQTRQPVSATVLSSNYLKSGV
jgi:non-ribosomal peptide synthase protein (TIGR01720 family)